jgi:hypothetical protein
VPGRRRLWRRHRAHQPAPDRRHPAARHGFVAHGGLFAEVQWDFRGPFPDSHGDGTLWGTPAMLRHLAAVATQAAIQAEEEAAWQAHTTTAAAQGSRVA